MEELKISSEKLEFYENMIDNWANRSFENKEDKHEFILMIRNLLYEDEEEIEFEAIVYFLNYLSGCVYLKKVDYFPGSQNIQ